MSQKLISRKACKVSGKDRKRQWLGNMIFANLAIIAAAFA
jgi:hypothetical protein